MQRVQRETLFASFEPEPEPSFQTTGGARVRAPTPHPIASCPATLGKRRAPSSAHQVHEEGDGCKYEEDEEKSFGDPRGQACESSETEDSRDERDH